MLRLDRRLLFIRRDGFLNPPSAPLFEPLLKAGARTVGGLADPLADSGGL